MKAVLCKQFGPPDSLVVEDVPSPKASAGEVVIAVKAASVNFPDVLIIQNKYQFKPPLPFSPGSELAGVVKEVGAGVQGFKPGDKVMAFTTYGAFAEEVRTEASRAAFRCRKRWTSSPGAAFLLTYGTTDHALRDRGALAAGETLLVLGAAGGVGLAAIEIGKALGARVIACASSEDKLAVCREHGADATINYAAEDLRERVKALTEGRGADVIYDPVGGAVQRAGVPLHRLARPAPGGRLRRGRNPEAAAQPRAAQGRGGARRVLGRLRAPRAEAVRRQRAPARQVVPRRPLEVRMSRRPFRWKARPKR